MMGDDSEFGGQGEINPFGEMLAVGLMVSAIVIVLVDLWFLVGVVAEFAGGSP